MAKSKGTRRWLDDHTSDFYVKQAQKEGLRSRAAFKLKEIQEKHKLIQPGMQVVELGAAPGGWSELIVKWLGKKGHLYALDLLPMDPIHSMTFIQGDIQDEAVWADLIDKLPEGQADCVLSDMAPNLTGQPSVDAYKVLALLETAKAAADDVLKEGGSFCVKAFQGPGFEAFVSSLRTSYAKVQIFKPKASRTRSTEVYLVAKQKRG